MDSIFRAAIETTRTMSSLRCRNRVDRSTVDNDNTPSIRTILNCGLGLVTIDSSSSKARLVHFTLQEHIMANPTLFYTPHSMIAEVCLTYLNFRCIRDLSPVLRPLPPTTPFLEYASHYWGAHARRQTSTSVISLGLNLLDGFEAHISCELLLRQEYDAIFFQPDGSCAPLNCTALHAGVFLGVPEIMDSLLKIDKWDLNATDQDGRTALMCATKIGHDAIVKVLLEEGVDPDISDPSGRTPLSWAAGDGYEEIVEMLLERNDVNPDTADMFGRTPLSWAAEHGRENIVRTLLERNDVNPDTADRGGQTPLAWASGAEIMSRDAEEEHERVVKILLERNDVNPDSADISGRTPLSWAAAKGFAGVLWMLLERNDVNPDRADQDGRTPLLWAASNGSADFLWMGWDRSDVSPDRVGASRRTPPSRPAGPGVWSQGFDSRCERVVRILLERNDVNPDSADTSGRTPLSWAAESGLAGVLRTLLERNDVGPDSADKSGRTPLSWAAGPKGWLHSVSGGQEGAVRTLLERNEVNPDSADAIGRTPFS